MATISSEVATGRRIKGREGLMRGDPGGELSSTFAALAFLPHAAPAFQRGGVALVQGIEEALAAFERHRVVLNLVQHAFALFGAWAFMGGCWSGGRGCG